MTENTILCVLWGDKYGREFVEKLKDQCEKKCSVPYNFFCLTDNPLHSYDIPLPVDWNDYENGNFWAYRKLYMFNESHYGIRGDNFLYMDLDVIIHQDLKYFFELEMDRPYIVRGWWNDLEECKKNFSRFKSTPINSSIIRWNKNQLVKVYNHISKNIDTIFFTYPTIDNYLNHFFYNMYDENEESFFNVFPAGDVYSWYKGNSFPDDMEPRKIRTGCKVCLFNNSSDMDDVSEIKMLWET